MKFKFNTGIFAIETDANSYKISMAITILSFLLADILVVLNCNTLGWIQYLIYVIILAIEILFVILIIRGRPLKQNDLSPSQIFPGVWKNTWTHKGETDFQKFKIIEEKQYHVLNKTNGKWEYTFDIIHCEDENNKITFAKIHSGDKNPFSFNKLKRINPKRIEGNESNNTYVVYERIE